MRSTSRISISLLYSVILLLGAVSPSFALDVPVSFQITPSATAVAVQFDVVSSVAGVTLSPPVLEGAAAHVVDSQVQANGATRFVVYSSADIALSHADPVNITLGVQQASLQDSILSVSGVVASDSDGATVIAAPGAFPVILSVNPPLLAKAAVGRNILVGVEVVDLNGTVSSVSFRLNCSPVGTDLGRPFATSLTSASAGDFAFSVLAQDNQLSVSASPAPPVGGPAGTTVFTIQFTPTTSGAKTAAIHIASDDVDENPFDITLIIGATGEDSNAIVINGDQGNNSESLSGAVYVFDLGTPPVIPGPNPFVITDSFFDGTYFTLHFTGEAGVTNWRVMGSPDLTFFPDDWTSTSYITETSPGIYEVGGDLGEAPARYFLRIER